MFVCSELGEGATTESENILSELLMCGGGVRSIVLLPLVASCIETINVCVWRMFVFVCCSDCVGYVEMCVVQRALMKIVF